MLRVKSPFLQIESPCSLQITMPRVESAFFLPFKSQHLCYSEINYMSICSLVKTTRTSEISQLPASFACNRAQERCQASDGSGRPWERNMAIFKWTVWKLDTFMSTIHEIFWEMSWRWIWYTLRYPSKKKSNLKMQIYCCRKKHISSKSRQLSCSKIWRSINV